MKKFFEFGGVAAGIILIAFGVAAIVLGFNGKSTVADNLKQQQIVGTPDMNPKDIAQAAQASKLPSSIPLPTCSVAGKAITNGTLARCFAEYMQIHAYEATGGVPYSQMPRYASPDGKGTNDPLKATTVNGQPQDNAARNVWVTETALTTALNMSFMAEQLGNFGIVVGIALLLSGFGFVVLALGGALRAAGWVVPKFAAKKRAKPNPTAPLSA